MSFLVLLEYYATTSTMEDYLKNGLLLCSNTNFYSLFFISVKNKKWNKKPSHETKMTSLKHPALSVYARTLILYLYKYNSPISYNVQCSWFELKTKSIVIAFLTNLILNPSFSNLPNTETVKIDFNSYQNSTQPLIYWNINSAATIAQSINRKKLTKRTTGTEALSWKAHRTKPNPKHESTFNKTAVAELSCS